MRVPCLARAWNRREGTIYSPSPPTPRMKNIALPRPLLLPSTVRLFVHSLPPFPYPLLPLKRPPKMVLSHSTFTNILLLLLVLLAITFTNAAVLPIPHPHPHTPLSHTIDPRTPLIATNQEGNHDVFVTLNDAKDPKTFWKDLGDFFAQYDFFDFLRNLVGARPGPSGSSSGVLTTTTVFITPTPTPTLTLTLTLTPTPTPTTNATDVVVVETQPTQTLGPTSSSAGGEEQGTFTILPWYPPGEGLSDNVTVPAPTALPVVSDDFPNEPTLTAGVGTTGSGGDGVSILPWFPSGGHLSDNVTVTGPTTTGIEVEPTDPVISILPVIPSGQNLSDNITFPEPTPTGIEVEPTDPVISILPIIPIGQNLTDNITLPFPIAISVEFPNEPTLVIDPPSIESSIVSEGIVTFLPPTPTLAPPGNLPTAKPSGPTFVIVNGTKKLTRTAPWILTNPLRPTDGPAPVPFPTPNTSESGVPGQNQTPTLTVSLKSTKYVYITVTPTPIGTAISVLPLTLSLPVQNTSAAGIPAGINSTTNLNTTVSLPTAKATATSTPIFTPLIPIPTPNSSNAPSPVFAPDALKTLRNICTDPKIHTITLPLLSRFYGPNAYPSLTTYPGCAAPNARQAQQAPGLLNCSQLGAEVARCQKEGRRVLLGVEFDGAGAVNGNLLFGSAEGRLPVPVVGLPGVGGARAPLKDLGEPWRNWTSPIPTPNLFNPRHPPTAFALTLFSLFGAGTTERKDLRPLGPDPVPDTVPDPTLPSDPQALSSLLLHRPLGENVVLDGFDVRVPGEWKGRYQGDLIEDFVGRLRELEREGEGGGVVVVGEV
ncbi:hypothetical protein P280DRAFT_551538 [Massarina eburnea CBS 473.64]|uniref:Uncharacterized protein n=1 Tax=Massarina eburnea CBS 473.64 TaxID=1395130 RepID=A0A6A6RTV0_9PLEO|nr:hypothetical protein P280DRAFT_551538 [Massarina eburnea CBS 473.64]